VNRQELPLPSTKQGISALSVDGGKVRRRVEPKAGSHWKDYKAVRLQSIYYGAFFDDNQSLIDYVNSQKLHGPTGKVWEMVIKEFGI